MDVAEERLPIDMRLIVIDETKYWDLDEADMARIKALGTVYAYDANQHTYVAELRPSYCLYPIQPYTDFAEVPENEYGDTDFERFVDKIDMLQYENMDYSVTYMHVSQVDELEMTYKSLARHTWKYDHFGTFPRVPEDEDQTEEEWFEEVLDSVRENCSL